MAQFAAILVRSGLEFTTVRVGVAIHADQLVRLVCSFFAGRLMTLLTFELEMLTFQFEGALLVRFAGVERRLELHFVVTGVAIGARGAAFKLATMNIFVAIAAQGVSDRRTEIVVLMALCAVALRVLAVEREFGLVMIEAAGGEDCFPAAGRVAGLAGALERRILKSSAVRIGVAVLAIGECEAFVTRIRFARLGTVTFHASDILMQPGERVSSAEMLEAFGGFPGVLIVASEALGAELARVGILMATETFLSQAQERLVKVFDLDLQSRGCRDV